MTTTETRQPILPRVQKLLDRALATGSKVADMTSPETSSVPTWEIVGVNPSNVIWVLQCEGTVRVVRYNKVLNKTFKITQKQAPFWISVLGRR